MQKNDEVSFFNTRTISLTIFFVIICFLFIIPFYWMVISSFKSSQDIFTHSLNIIPQNPIIENYTKLTSIPYFRWFLNSLIFAGGYIILGLFVCSLGGFAFAKYDFKFKNIIFIAIVAAQMLPIHMQLIPLFITLNKINFINSYTGLILPMIANPLGIFLIRQYMVGIQDDLIDAARVDGASEWQIYYRIMLPVSKPVLAAVAILFSIFSWNNLVWPLVVMRSQEMFTLTVGLSSLIGQYRPQYGLLMAGSTVAVVPIVILFLRMQEHFISGLTAGSVKG